MVKKKKRYAGASNSRLSCFDVKIWPKIATLMKYETS